MFRFWQVNLEILKEKDYSPLRIDSYIYNVVFLNRCTKQRICRHNVRLARSQRSEGVRRSDFDSIYNSVFCFIFWKIFNDYNMIIQDNEQLWLHVKYHYGSLKSICNTFISFSALRKSSKLRFWQHLQLSFIFYFWKPFNDYSTIIQR